MQLEFKAGNNKKYKIDGTQDSAIYAKELTIGQLLGLYYLVSQKGYPEEKNTWEPASAIQYLQRLVTAYHKNNAKKPTAISLPAHMASSMAKPIAAPTKKRGQLAKSTTTTTKQAKKFQAFFLLDPIRFSSSVLPLS